MRRPQPAPEPNDLLRRRGNDLGKAFQDAGYRQVMHEVQASYKHWDKVRRIASDRGVDPELVWLIVRMSRRMDARAVALTAADGTAISYTLPDRLQRELMLIDQRLAGRVGIESDPRIGQHRNRFIASSLMEEAIASSMLEGASTTVRVAKDMLRSGRKPRTSGERMITNNYRAIEFIRSELERPLSPGFLIELQSILTKDTLERPDECGRLRKPGEDVIVKDTFEEIMHEPPPAEQLDERLRRLCAFANEPVLTEDGRFMHPFIRAALLHFQISYDHPFCDGNGRTARAMFYWSMLRAGYWLFEFLPISRLIYKSPAEYGRAFLYTETDEFDATYFLIYHARIVKKAHEDLDAYLARQQREAAEARDLFTRDRDLNDRQRVLLLHAVQNRDALYTIESHQNSHGVSYGTARNDLLHLVDRGYLSITRSGRLQRFIPGRKVVAARARA